MKVSILLASLSVCYLLGACTSPPSRTRGEAAGVRVTATLGAWDGEPTSLASALTPLHVDIANESDRAVTVRYDEITINGPALLHEPLPPRQLAGREVIEKSQDSILVPRFKHSRFYAAGGYLPNFTDLRPWDYPWDADRNFYVRQYPKWPVSLPTVDMIQAALPEGVLEPGGRVSGFLYYEKLDPDIEEWTLAFDLIQPRSGLAFGTVRATLPAQ